MLVEDLNKNKIDGIFVVFVKRVHCTSLLRLEENPI
jgi:hypothetical protein